MNALAEWLQSQPNPDALVVWAMWATMLILVCWGFWHEGRKATRRRKR